MGYDGEVAAGKGGQREDTAHGGQLLAGETSHDAGFAEEGFHGGVARGDGAGVRRGGTAATLRTAGLDGGDAASLADERCGMEEQLVGVGDVLDIEQFHLRVGGGVEMLIHVLQHIFNAYLLAVADTPDRAELQALDDGRLKDEYGGGTTAADEIHTLGVELGDGLGEHAVVPLVEQADAVRTNQRSTVSLATVEDALFQRRTRLCLLAKTGGDDDEGFHSFRRGQQLHVVGTILGGHHENGQLRGRYLLGIMEYLDALHLVFLRVDDAKGSLKTTLYEVANHGSTGLVYIIGASDDHDALGS